MPCKDEGNKRSDVNLLLVILRVLTNGMQLWVAGNLLRARKMIVLEK